MQRFRMSNGMGMMNMCMAFRLPSAVPSGVDPVGCIVGKQAARHLVAFSF